MQYRFFTKIFNRFSYRLSHRNFNNQSSRFSSSLNRSSKAFTLIEILIYTAIFSVVAAGIIGVAWNVTRIHTSQIAENEVDENLRYVMDLINSKVRDASIIQDATGTTLILQMPDSTKSPVIFSLNNGTIFMQEGTADPVAITSDKVVVTALEFQRVSMPRAKDGVRINLTIAYKEPAGSTGAEREYLTTVSRVHAIVFDSDILPQDSSLYNVGLDAARWKSGYFSDNINVGGNITAVGTVTGSAGLCMGSDCRSSWGQVTGVTGSGTQNYITKWASSGSLTNSQIFDNGTNVGIGTTSPAALLDVQGAAQFGTGNVNLINAAGKIAGISSTYFADLSGANLTNLNASNLGSGTVPSARISGSYTGITGVGTLTAGTWNATAIADAYIASASTWNAKMTNPMTTVGDIIYGGTSGAPTRLAGSAGFLKSTGAAVPTWTTLSTDDIPGLDANKITSGTLPVARGGTGAGTFSSGYLIKGNGTNALSSSVIYDNGTNVGIGTTSPGYKLDIRGGGHVSTESNTLPFVISRSYKTSNFEEARFGVDDANFYLHYINDESMSIFQLRLQNTDTETGGGVDAKDVTFYFKGTGDFNVPGNVGIGTTSPGQKLDVSGGNIRTTGQLISTVAAGTAPLVVTSNTLVTNLNADLLDGHDTSYFQTALTNPITGTGSANYISKWTGTNTQGNSIIYDNGTNVGIGTTGPTAKTEITGSGYLFRLSGAGTADYKRYSFYQDVDRLRLIRTLDNGDYGSDLVTFQGNGNVGIGTTSPGYKLDVVGDIKASGSIYGTYAGTIAATKVSAGAFGADTGGGNYSFPGNVGIGTTSPGAKLAIYGGDDKDTGPIINLGGNATNQFESGRIRFTETNMGVSPYYQGGFIHYDGSANVLNIGVHNVADALQSSDINAISIERGNGNVGIGTTGPIDKLHISSGNIRVSNTNAIIALDSGTSWSKIDASNGGSIFFYGSGSSNVLSLEHTNAIQAYINGASRLYINSSGNVGIGTTSPGALLDVQGAAQFGSGNVNLIDATGKIAGISSAYFADLSGANLTNLNASNLGSGTVPTARISGSYTGITGVGTLTAGTWNASTISTSYTSAKDTTDDSWTGTGNVYTTSGNVGIGTTSPGYKLDVAGTVGFQTAIYGNAKAVAETGDAFLRINQSNQFTNGIWFGSSDLKMGGGILRIGSQGGAGEVEISGTSGDATTRISISGNSGANSWFNTGGKIGIGTTSPAKTLDVIGDIQASGSVYGTYAGTIAATKVAQGQFGADTGGGNYSFPGNVGIGTTSPTTELQVAGKIKTISFQLTTGAIANYVLTADASGNATWKPSLPGLPSATTGQTIYFNGTNWAASSNLYNNDSKVGVGTTSPQAKLHVYATSGSYTCTGVATACSNFDNQTACTAQTGCSWTQITGDCKGFYDQTTCESYDGCLWTGSYCNGSYITYICNGTPNQCSTFGNQTACQAQSGCSWTLISDPAAVFIGGRVGIGTTNPATTTALDVNGIIQGQFADKYTGTTSRSGSNGTTSHSTGKYYPEWFCALSKVDATEIDSGTEHAYCNVRLDASNQWILDAIISGYADQAVSCGIYCIRL